MGLSDRSREAEEHAQDNVAEKNTYHLAVCKRGVTGWSFPKTPLFLKPLLIYNNNDENLYIYNKENMLSHVQYNIYTGS